VAEAKRNFADRDGDGDGKLSVAEFTLPIEQARFRKWDADRDGHLSLEELVKGSPEMAKNGTGAKALAAMDANHDGVLEEKEYSLQIESFFVRDKNADGKLDGTEYLFYSRTLEQIAAQRKDFSQRDRGKNGWLSLEEFTVTPKTSK
jgi:Ca2+-binding EF-hand superfamily protein